MSKRELPPETIQEDNMRLTVLHRQPRLSAQARAERRAEIEHRLFEVFQKHAV